MNRSLYYNGPPDTPPTEPIRFQTNLRDGLEDPAGYIPHPDLIKAVNTAMILGQPLLLTGAPGVGKSRLAGAVSHALGLGEPGEVIAKSDMRAADLFYEFDHVRRLFDAQVDRERRRPNIAYLNLRPLGRAILLAGGPNQMTTPLKGSGAQPVPFRELEHLLGDRGFRGAEDGLQSVVLIDEIDKAPRDVPNDILNEIDRMFFDIPEIGQRVEAPRDRRPFVVMTSNSEKSMPGPFLRRCVFFSIPSPERDPDDPEVPSLSDIVASRISQLETGGPILTEAIDLFTMFRDPQRNFDHKPSVSELMNWMLVLVERAGVLDAESLRDHPDAVYEGLSVMLKSTRDQDLGRKVVEKWLTKRG